MTKANKFAKILDHANLPVSLVWINKVLIELNSAALSDGFYRFSGQCRDNLSGALSQIANTVGHELDTRTFIAIDSKNIKLWSSESPLFGKDVFDKFGTAREDIEEAGKCLALDRNTAAVFHLMRALECSVQIIAQKIGAAIKDQHGKGLPWGVIAQNMKLKIDSMQQGSDDQLKWYRVQSDLVVVNRAWRVPTNHPKYTYTAEQAQEVFSATKAFMRELSGFV